MREGEKQFLGSSGKQESGVLDVAAAEKVGWRESKIVRKPWFQVVAQARGEFPEVVARVIDTLVEGGKISDTEHSALNFAVRSWWQDRFGFSFEKKAERQLLLAHPEPLSLNLNRRSEESFRKRAEAPLRGETEPDIYAQEKIFRMERLHAALRQLDGGESIREFEYATRRRVYYDSGRGAYFVRGENARSLTLGDILSDYAWDIKYAPDSNMAADKQRFRTLVKHILVNEARRDIELIYNKELVVKKPGVSAGLQSVSPLLMKRKLEVGKGQAGAVAEIMAREMLARMAFDRDMGFAVFRANSLEDSMYKYDFKLQARKKKRGVAVEDEQGFAQKTKNIGIQFTIGKKHPAHCLFEAKIKYRDELPVDDIVLIKIRSEKFEDAFNEWLRNGKPSGGPERFLPRNIKMDILKKSTDGFVQLSDEETEQAIGFVS